MPYNNNPYNYLLQHGKVLDEFHSSNEYTGVDAYVVEFHGKRYNVVYVDGMAMLSKEEW